MAVNLHTLIPVYRRLIAGVVLCRLCDARIAPGGIALCQHCRHDLPYLGAACPCCAKPMPSGQRCPNCMSHPRSGIDRTLALLHYHYPVDCLVRDMKYQARPELAAIFGRLLYNRLQDTPRRMPAALLPVPLHWRRLAERGYNQSVEIARPVGALCRIPVLTTAVKRVRHTRPQTALSPPSRRRNMAGAFVTTGRERLPNHVAIVDDVVTSGATVSALARTLKQAGVGYVEVWACARTG